MWEGGGDWTVCRFKRGLFKKEDGGVDTPMHTMHIKKLDNDLQCVLLWRPRLLEEKDNVFTIINSFLGRYLRKRLINVAAF